MLMTPRRVAYLVLSFLCLCFFIKYRRWAFDDAFIAYRYAENILNGHGWVYNLGEQYNASTSVLNIILLIVLTPIFRNPLTASIFLGTASIFAASVLVFRWLENFDEAYALLASALFAFHLSESWGWGIETLPFIALVFLFVELETKGKSSWWLLGLIVLMRPDGLILVLLKLAHDVWKRRLDIKGVAIFCLILAPWVLFSLYQFGQVFPSTLEKKIWQGRSGFWGEGYIYLQGLIGALKTHWFGKIGLPLIPFTIIGLHRVIRERSKLIYLIIFFAAQQSFYVLMNVPPYHWYFTPVLALERLLFLIGLGVVVVGYAPKFKYALPVVATIVVALFLILYPKYFNNPAETPRTVAYRTLALEIRERFPDASIAALELGALGYYGKTRTYDLTGLTNKDPEFLTTENLNRFFEIKPRIVVLFDPPTRMEESLFRDARFFREYRLAGGSQGFRYYEAMMPK